jgi:hypothetical protein
MTWVMLRVRLQLSSPALAGHGRLRVLRAARNTLTLSHFKGEER